MYFISNVRLEASTKAVRDYTADDPRSASLVLYRGTTLVGPQRIERELG
jgi:hypothetical protein